MHIRRARPEDAPVIADFNAAMAVETEHLTLDRERLLLGVRALLAEAGKGFYLVVEREGAVIGQVMITYEWSDWRNGTFWWIQSVYVAPEHRRSGVFRALYGEVESLARASGDCCGLRLYVEKTNLRAQATYFSLGMSATHYDLYEVDFTR
jgi:ribosomal protein S18 acetylase RimI-like enzyme